MTVLPAARSAGADSRDAAADLVTRTGYAFHVRPVTADDEPALAAFFTHVTPEELRFRFLSAVCEAGHAQIEAMTMVDHDRTETFIAEDADGLLIASGMLAADAARERGEVAISIRADHKNRGISWTLLEHIARYAEAHGIKVLESIEARSNRAAIELEQEMGFKAEAIAGDPTLVRVYRRLD